MLVVQPYISFFNSANISMIILQTSTQSTDYIYILKFNLSEDISQIWYGFD